MTDPMRCSSRGRAAGSCGLCGSSFDVSGGLRVVVTIAHENPAAAEVAASRETFCPACFEGRRGDIYRALGDVRPSPERVARLIEAFGADGIHEARRRSLINLSDYEAACRALTGHADGT